MRLPWWGRSTARKRACRKYFEASVDTLSDWYGVSREEVMDLVAEKMLLGYLGPGVFEAVRADLESRPARILDRA